MNAEGTSVEDKVADEEKIAGAPVPCEGEQPVRPALLGAWARDTFQEIAGLDLRSLAVFRMGLGLVLLVDLFIRAGDLHAHYTDQGILPREAISHLKHRLSLHVFSGALWFEAVLFALAAVFAVALLLGFRTRLATFLSWFMLLSLQARNPIILQAGDILLRLLLFWGMFLPLGACWSVDSLVAPVRQRRWRITSLAGFALLLQICLVYWCSAALKSHSSWRTEGTAVYYALSFDQLVTPLGEILLDYPNLLYCLTFATLWLEVVGPMLLFFPYHTAALRIVVVFTFLSFHLVGLGLCMELGPFPYVCAVAWIALLPTSFWDYLAQRWPLRLGLSAEDSAAPADEMPGERMTQQLRRKPLFLLSRLFLAGSLIYVLLWNVRTLDFDHVSKIFPVKANAIGFALGLDQWWAMFAPMPATSDGWYVIEGELRNGSKVDLFRGGAPLTWSKPKSVSSLYANERWRKYGTNLNGTDYEHYRIHYARYLARRWNAEHEPEQKLKSVRIYFMLEETLPNYETPKVEKRLLQDYQCTEADDGFH